MHPPDARAIFLHNDLLCSDTGSVIGVEGGGGGGGGASAKLTGTKGKDPTDDIKKSDLIFFTAKPPPPLLAVKVAILAKVANYLEVMFYFSLHSSQKLF